MKAFPIIGLIKYGNVFFNQTTPLTTDGTIISNLEEFAAFRIAFATVVELRDIGENFGIFSNDGCSKKFVLTIIGLTTVIPTPVFFNSCFNPSENPNIANFDAQYEAIPGKPKLAATDATLTMWLCI